MKNIKHVWVIVAALLVLGACQKEISFESGNTLGQASGSLQDTSNNCYTINVQGKYIQDSTLTDSNFVSVQAYIDTPGYYLIYTDLRNGFSFRDSGFVTSNGLQTFKLKGSGKPLVPGINDFSVIFGTGVCSFSVVTTAAVTGPPAAFTLGGSPAGCTGASVQGTYQAGTPLTTANKVDINVTVTTPGSYNITTVLTNGMTFSASGNLTAVGPATITLMGSGTPTTTGPNTIPINVSGSNCTFLVTVTTGIIQATDYFPTTTNSNWTYTADLSPTDSAKYVALPSNTTIASNQYRNFLIQYIGAPNDTFYYRKANGLYYEFGSVDLNGVLGVLDTVYNDVEFIFLKDNVPTASTWETAEVNAAANSLNGKAKLKFTIVQKDVQQLINGVVVDSVIGVQRQLMFQPTGGAYTTVDTLMFYYAKGKGLLLITGTRVIFPFRVEAKRYQVF